MNKFRSVICNVVVLFIFALPFSLDAKIYDCFMFNFELDLLEIRLNEMYNYVDHFVLVECTQTHRGNPKPLYYEMNKDRFSRFNDKIIHVKVTDDFPTHDLWAREGFQRDQIMRGIRHCTSNDVIIVSDLDEIIRGKDLPGIIPYIEKVPYVACQLDLFVYYLNGFCGQWNGPVITKFGWLRRTSANKVRALRNSSFTVQNAGWHFSSAGGVQANLLKYASNVHGAEYPNVTEERIRADIEATPCIPLDSLFPQYVIDHLEDYVQKGWIKENCTSSRAAIGTHIHW